MEIVSHNHAIRIFCILPQPVTGGVAFQVSDDVAYLDHDEKFSPHHGLVARADVSKKLLHQATRYKGA